MKFTISLDILKNELKRATPFTGGRTTLPILANVHINADMESNLVCMTATNLDSESVSYFNAVVDESGETTINARCLQQVLDNIKVKEISLECVNDNPNTTIKYGRSSVLLLGLPVKDFPKFLLDGEINQEVSIYAHDFFSLLKSVKISMAYDNSKVFMNGVHFIFDMPEGKVIAEATNGYIFTKSKLEISERGEKKMDFIIPAKVVDSIDESIFGSDEKLKVLHWMNCIEFVGEKTRFACKFVRADFPDTTKFTPNVATYHKIEINRKLFLEKINLIRAFCDEHHPGVIIHLTRKDMKFTVESASKGAVDDFIEFENEIETVKPDEIVKVKINSVFAHTVLKSGKSSEITVMLKSPTTPIVLREHDIDTFSVLMPMFKREPAPAPAAATTPASDAQPAAAEQEKK